MLVETGWSQRAHPICSWLNLFKTMHFVLESARTYTPHGTQNPWGALCFYLVQPLEKKHVHLCCLGFFQHGATRQTGAAGGTNSATWRQHRKPAATGRASAAGRAGIVRRGDRHRRKQRQRLCLSVLGKPHRTLGVPLRWCGLDCAASCRRFLFCSGWCCRPVRYAAGL